MNEDGVEDVQFEEDAAEEGVARDAAGVVKKLKDELNKIKAEKQEYLDGWQRSKADYVNLLKRTDADARGAKLKGVMDAVEALLPAYDALERAKEHLSAQAGGEIPEGFQAIAKQLESAFKSLGLSEVGQVGEQFDPTLHEALGQDKVESASEDNTVTAVLEKGYQLGDILLRPAKVRVAHFA